MVIRKSRRRRRSSKRRKSPKKRVSRKKKSLKKPKKRVSKRRSKHNKKYLTSRPSETKTKSEPTKRGEHLTIPPDWRYAYKSAGLRGNKYDIDAPFQIRKPTDPEPESRSFY